MLGSLPKSVNEPETLAPDAFERGLALAKKLRSTDPETALDGLRAAAVLDPQNPSVAPLEIELLKGIVAAKPDDTNRVVELAVVYENHNDLPASWSLLRPYRDRLGATEGARILGQKLLQEQDYPGAYRLLFPYVETRLARLHGIETSYSNTLAAVSEAAVADLNAGRGEPGFYSEYKTATKVRQSEMVNEYIDSRMKTDPRCLRAVEDLKEANQIVPVALDLGVVQLNRAQALSEAAARKAELEAAEKTFLAIRGFAGETDEYRLFLGQVYYWLGRSNEGRELFDQLLEGHRRSFTILMSVSQSLRLVGEQAAARKLGEEAYRAGAAAADKYAAASFLALMSKDEDDRIQWLEKADPQAAWVQAELNGARGKKALEQSNKPLAAQYLRKAMAGYEAQPKTSASLNNWALVCFDLYAATGEAAAQQQGTALIEEAVAMEPGNSILLQNVAYFLIGQAVLDVNQEAIHFAQVGEQPGLEALALLYQDETGRTQIFQALKDSEAMKTGLGYLDKSLLLASFPSWVGSMEWAMLRNMDPALAAEAAQRLKANETVRLVRSLEMQINPWGTTSVLGEYWMQRLLGDEKRAGAIYQKALADGVPLPPL